MPAQLSVPPPVGSESISRRSFEPLHAGSAPSGPSKLETVLLAIAVISLNCLGNLSLAWGLKRVPPVGVNPLSYVAAMLNPFVAAGIVLLVLWLLTRMALMSWADLSFALPMMAIGYVVAALLGKFVLDENVGTPRWCGIVLIFAGSSMVGTTAHRTSRKGPPA